MELFYEGTHGRAIATVRSRTDKDRRDEKKGGKRKNGGQRATSAIFPRKIFYQEEQGKEEALPPKNN